MSDAHRPYAGLETWENFPCTIEQGILNTLPKIDNHPKWSLPQLYDTCDDRFKPGQLGGPTVEPGLFTDLQNFALPIGTHGSNHAFFKES